MFDNRIVEAAHFAAIKHKSQRRKDVDKTPYINHPLALANVLAVECDIDDVEVICGALLHDTIEDTDTSEDELVQAFGETIAQIVVEVTDDKSLPKLERKEAQVSHSPHISHRAKLVKLADKICNLRDVSSSPPIGWSVERRQEYFDWAARVVNGLRGAHPRLESLFDDVFLQRPTMP
jgi:guanosine-3',5'-bis(diphosphate) 3'-pyrophosphohydrolase